MGRKGQLPWSLPSEFQLFVSKTTGSAIVVGRCTFLEEGIYPMSHVSQHYVLASSPLPQEKLYPDQVLRCESISDCLQHHRKHRAHTDLWFIGGSCVFEEGAAYADELHLTVVHADVEGDVFFPLGKVLPSFPFLSKVEVDRESRDAIPYSVYVLGKRESEGTSKVEWKDLIRNDV